MKFIYFDASSGISGDMMLGALLDIGVSRAPFREKMASLDLPVKIDIKETKRAGLRGLKVDIKVQRSKASRGRCWEDVKVLVAKSAFSSGVKEKAQAIFKNLFAAEARVHGTKFEATHLHEAAADDAIIDVLGSCYLAEVLDIGRVYCSPLNVGRGWARGSHGLLPVPPPAVAEILKQAPVYSAWADEELVTPTGAAIVATWTEKYVPFPEMTYEKIGCGAGSRDFANFPNILRAFYGEEKEFRSSRTIYQVEANLDDANPQLLARFVERGLKLGAVDVFLTPVVMKKGRLGTKLTLLADAAKIDALIEAVFRETTSIGLRLFPVERRVLHRGTRKVRVLGEDIGIKIATLAGEEVNAQPEFSDCLAVAEKKKLPTKVITQMALAEYSKKNWRKKARKGRG
ncbi:MAG: nickel pincer cofactor biosynthesis protein LarC [Clostridiales bacterium]|nr:nickel pincer cofactor biosynthesis protein LarC [Clostridiales bacterium]